MNNLKLIIPILLFSLGLIIVNIPVHNIEYGVNEYKKNIFILYLTIMLVFALAAFSLKLFPILIPVNSITTIILLILAYNIIRASFIKDYDFKYLFELWAAIFFYFLFVQFLHINENNKTINRILFAVIAICLLLQLLTGFLQVFGAYQSYNNYFVTTGTFENPGHYAIFLASNFAFLITWLLLRTKKKLSLFLIITLFITVCVITGILSRSALIGLLSSFLLFVYFNKGSKFFFKPNHRKFGILLISSLLIGILYVLYFIKKDSADGRLVIWEISKPIAKEHWLTGIGYNRTKVQYNIYQAKYFENHPEKKESYGMYVDYTKSIFNDFYQVLCEQGIFGLCFFIFLLYKLIIYQTNLHASIKQNFEKLSSSTFISICSFHAIFVLIVASLFTDVFEQFPLLVLFFFYLTLISVEIGKSFKLFHLSKKLVSKISILLNIALFIGITYTTRRTFQLHVPLSNIKEEGIYQHKQTKIENLPIDNEYYLTNMCETLILNEDIEKSLSFMEDCKKYSSHWKLYLSIGILYRENKNYLKSEQNLLIAHNMIPHLVYPKFLLAKVYLESEQYLKWERMANRVLNEREKVPSKRIDAMREEIRELLEKQASQIY